MALGTPAGRDRSVWTPAQHLRYATRHPTHCSL